jgi:hypothetical protein
MVLSILDRYEEKPTSQMFRGHCGDELSPKQQQRYSIVTAVAVSNWWLTLSGSAGL